MLTNLEYANLLYKNVEYFYNGFHDEGGPMRSAYADFLDSLMTEEGTLYKLYNAFFSEWCTAVRHGIVPVKTNDEIGFSLPWAKIADLSRKDDEAVEAEKQALWL